MTAPADLPRGQRGARFFLALALVLLLGTGAAAGLLAYTDRLGPLLSAPPLAEAELPPRQTQPETEPDGTSAAAAGEAIATAETPVRPGEPAATTPSEAGAATPSAPTSVGTLPAPPSLPEPADAETAPEPAASEPAGPVPAEPEATVAADNPAATMTELAAAMPPSPAAPEPSLAPPWKRYARPFPTSDARPRIAIVITELGLSRAATEAAIERLPPEVTLAFNPLAPNLRAWIVKARARGHEVMLDLPMEPLGYPQQDPGPHALMASLDPAENARRLEFLLERADGYVGVATYMGSRFEGSVELIRPVLRTLAERGLMFLANGSAPSTQVPELAGAMKLPLINSDQFLDGVASRAAIDGRLKQLEELARTNQGAVAIGFGYPVTIERVGAWAGTLGARNIALAPASALVGVAAP